MRQPITASANSSFQKMRRLLDLGAAAYLTKPIDIAELTRLLDSLPTKPVAS